MIDDIFTKFDGAFAESTIKAYRSDFKQFNKWCVANGHAPLEVSAAHLADYIEYMSARWLERRGDGHQVPEGMAGHLSLAQKMEARTY
jgi:site-specific recombinase XerD